MAEMCCRGSTQSSSFSRSRYAASRPRKGGRKTRLCAASYFAFFILLSWSLCSAFSPLVSRSDLVWGTMTTGVVSSIQPAPLSSAHSSSFTSSVAQLQWEGGDVDELTEDALAYGVYRLSTAASNTWKTVRGVLTMGKGDGKKKRKKKSSGGGSGATTEVSTSPPPQRVSNDINIPVRRQIRYAQMRKEALRQSGTSFRQTNVKRTKYRKTLDEEEQEVARIERQKRGQEPDWDIILNNNASSPLVLVDAYNVIYQWPRLKKWMTKGVLRKARELLVRDLEELSAIKGWRIECVFDGFGRSTKGPLGDGPGGSQQSAKVAASDRLTTKKVSVQGVREVYSGVGASADAYIESRCFEAKQVTEGKLTGSLIVVSNDAMIRVVATNAGVLCMSSDRLVDELKAVKKAAAYRLEAAVAMANGQDVRPAQLRGKPIPNTFTGQFIIEDKKNRPKKPKRSKRMEFKDMVEGTKTVPKWAMLPNQTKPST